MAINGGKPLVDLNSSLRKPDTQQQAHRSPKTGKESSDSEKDRSELSARDREIQHFGDLIQSTPHIREARVEEVRSAIENGTYNVKAEKIADKILGGCLIDRIL